MAVHRMEHIGVVVNDLAGAIAFFLEVGLVLDGEGSVEGTLVDRIVGLDGVRSDLAFLKTPDGQGTLELTKFQSPAHEGESTLEPANAPGIRHILFSVDDIHDVVSRLQARGAELVGEVVNYENSYWLCYIRGPEGIIVELAEKITAP